MNTFLLISSIALWLLILPLGFLLVGALRAIGLLTWRLDYQEATRPSRPGRNGLRRGTKAPDFSLPNIEGWDVALHDFAERKVLLVFVQTGCAPCESIARHLNWVADDGAVQVLVVNNADRESARQWGGDVLPRFPVLLQDQFSLSRRYEVFATPFAFLIDEKGVITSRGIVKNREQIGFVLSGANAEGKNGSAHEASAPEVSVP